VRILFIENYSDEPRGGVKSLKTLFDCLKQEEDCKFLWRGKKEIEEENQESVKPKAQFVEENSPMEIRDFIAYREGLHNSDFKKKVEKFDPDLIVTQSAHSYFAVKYCQEREAESLIFLRAWELLYNTDEIHRGNMFVSKLANRFMRPLNERMSDYILENADYVVSNSEFTASTYEKKQGVKSEIVYPFVDIEKYNVEEKGEKILHVNPKREKGIELTLDVAGKMPEEDFILAGTTSDSEIEKRIEDLDNVEKLGYLDDMKKAYKQAKIVLVPSRWEEPFGRIPIEAGASGIPTIATDKGGLPESVGNQDLLIEEDPEEAVKKINKVENNYEEYSQKARENAVEKSMQKQVERFRKIISDID
jgi:glycosyltransferase involved in cell wall biosynthesis